MDSLRIDGGHWVDVAAGLDRARAVLAETGSEWLGLVADDRFTGWVRHDDVTSARSLDDLDPEAPAARVRAESSLREALEVILTQRTPTAVVEDADGTFRGLVQLETIRQGLTG